MTIKQNNFISIMIYLSFFCIGVWEADIASNHDPNNIYLTGQEKEGYAFTVCKSIINILTGIFGTLLSLVQRESEEYELKPKPELNQIYFINLGVTIWCIIIFSNIINKKSDIGPFEQVIVAEFIILIIGISCVLLVYCYITIISSIISENIIQNDKKNKTNDKNKIDIESGITEIRLDKSDIIININQS